MISNIQSSLDVWLKKRRGKPELFLIVEEKLVRKYSPEDVRRADPAR